MAECAVRISIGNEPDTANFRIDADQILRCVAVLVRQVERPLLRTVAGRIHAKLETADDPADVEGFCREKLENHTANNT